MDTYTYYSTIIKPTWAPPAWVFGPVWTVLYILIAISFTFVFLQILKKKLPQSTAVPFVLNLIANGVFTYFQFTLRNMTWALVDIFVVLATLIWAILIIKRKHPWVAWMNIPYLLWVSFATFLQTTITLLNR